MTQIFHRDPGSSHHVAIHRLPVFFVATALLFLWAPCGFGAAGDRDENVLFTPPGFSKPGQAELKSPAVSGRIKITVRKAHSGEPTFCRINVVGADGDYYYPKQNYLTPFALTGQWTGKPPNRARGNRFGKAPIRYIGRFFYSWGGTEVDVPPGPVRVEVWK